MLDQTWITKKYVVHYVHNNQKKSNIGRALQKKKFIISTIIVMNKSKHFKLEQHAQLPKKHTEQS